MLLLGWFGSDKRPVNLSEVTEQVGSDDLEDGKSCGRQLSLEPMRKGTTHRLRAEDLAILELGNLRLVDPEKQEREVRAHDPEPTVMSGGPVDDAVKDAFAHGLVRLGEIRFDKSHTHAVVFFSFVCGNLCGNVNAEILTRTKSGWKLQKRCGGWVS